MPSTATNDFSYKMETPVCYPKVGTSIDDDGRLQLVSVIGAGGYGNVYKAVDTMNILRPYYAVKCLPRYQSCMQEITLHQRASAHPGVITLLRVIEDNAFMYLVMDYAPDQDLFTQILHKRRYLGNDTLIKSTFLQILDVVEHCHSLGVYHRDLKPENFVCFEEGARVVLTDFGLATTERTSTEFQTGSVYHMSPGKFILLSLPQNLCLKKKRTIECLAAEMSLGGVYSPQSCDIWSLGIILLNIVTGRNPWNCAKWEDASFRSYHQNPYNQLPNVLPISPEVNEVLIAMLSMEWRARPSISEIRSGVRRIQTFYSGDVVFDGNVAKCWWESDRYKRGGVVTRRRVDDLEDPCISHRPSEQSSGNNLRTRIFKEKFPIFEEDSDDSQTSGGVAPRGSRGSDSSSSSSASSSTRSSLVSSFDKCLKSREKRSLGSFFGGIQSLFRFCPRKPGVGRGIV
jgi:serine/threonine protein kinase